MAVKNGKNGGVTGNEAEEDNAIPTPEAPKAVVTAAAEPPQANPTPEGEDTFTSQQLFGQKTYDQQMRVEERFAGLNRTDEISQLGGASKLEVDLAQMKIFSTDRIGDDLYAAIQRGDTTVVESMAGLNSDRRLTEAQILVLLKAKQEADEDLAKRAVSDAYIAQELHDKKKATDDAEQYEANAHNYDEFVEQGQAQEQAQQQAAMQADPTLMYSPQSQDFSRCGYNSDGSYNDSWGGRRNTDGTYTDPAGNTVTTDGRTVDQQGNWATADGSRTYDASTQTVSITAPASAAPAATVDAQGRPVAAPPPATVAVDMNTGNNAVTTIVTDSAAAGIDAAQYGGNPPAPTTTQQAAAADQAAMAAAANGQVAPAPTPLPRTAAMSQGGAVGTVATAAAVNGAHMPRGNPPQLMDAGQQVRNFEAARELGQTVVGMGNREVQMLTKWRHDATATAGRLTQSGQSDVARTQINLEDFVQMRLNDTSSTKLTAAQRVTYENQLEQLKAVHLANMDHMVPNGAVNLPAAGQTATATGPAAATELAAGATPSPLPAIDTTNLQVTDNSVKATGLYDENGGFQDGDNGFYDEFGGFYDKEGGYFDGMGGYYAKDGGFFDANGGYTWPDGGYEDKDHNYVDPKGNLIAADGTRLNADDYKLADGTNMNFKELLTKNAASGDKRVVMFDPETGGPSTEKTNAFLSTAPSWWNKSAEEKAEWKANSGVSTVSNYFSNYSFVDTTMYPNFNPLGNTTIKDPLSPLSPSLAGPSTAMA